MGISYNGSIVTNGLILYVDALNTRSYPGSGTTWSDLSNVSGNTSLVASPTFSNGAFTFDGASQYAIAPTNFFVPLISTPWTISLWFKTATSNDGTLFGQQSATTVPTGVGIGGWCPVIYLSGGKIRAEPFWTGNLSNGIFSPTNLNDNVWHNVQTTFSSGTHMLYIDGIYTGQQTVGQSAFGPYYYLIGAGYASGRGSSNFFTGSISTLSFYNIALTASEVRQNFNAMRGRYGV